MPFRQPVSYCTAMKSFEAKHYLLRAQIAWDRVKDREAYPYGLLPWRASTTWNSIPR